MECTTVRGNELRICFSEFPDFSNMELPVDEMAGGRSQATIFSDLLRDDMEDRSFPGSH